MAMSMQTRLHEFRRRLMMVEVEEQSGWEEGIDEEDPTLDQDARALDELSEDAGIARMEARAIIREEVGAAANEDRPMEEVSNIQAARELVDVLIRPSDDHGLLSPLRSTTAERGSSVSVEEDDPWAVNGVYTVLANAQIFQAGFRAKPFLLWTDEEKNDFAQNRTLPPMTEEQERRLREGVENRERRQDASTQT